MASCCRWVRRIRELTGAAAAPAMQEVIVEMTNDDGVGGVDYSFECIGNVQVLSQSHTLGFDVPTWLSLCTASTGI